MKDHQYYASTLACFYIVYGLLSLNTNNLSLLLAWFGIFSILIMRGHLEWKL